MGTLKDIVDTLGQMEGDVATLISGGPRMKSLSKASMDGTLNFPVIVSNALSVEDASLVSKALEREYASFVLTVMTMNPYLYTMGGKASAANYVKKFHQNLDTRFDSTDVINGINNFMVEEGLAIKGFEDYDVVGEAANAIVYKVYEHCKSHGLNAENAKFSYTLEEVTEPGILNNLANSNILLEAPRPITNTYSGDHVERGGIKQEYQAGSMHTELQSGSSYQNISTDGSYHHHVDNSVKNYNLSGKAAGKIAGISMGRQDARQFNHTSVSTDFKKANELVPTVLHMRIYPVDRDSERELPPIDFVVGIKTTLHPVASEEMTLNIARGIKNENTFFNFIRWTTGEISFFKDFVFSLNEIKIDAINAGSKASRWWTVLKRRRNFARVKNKLAPNRMLPNATLVITQEELELLKNTYGYDLEKVNLAYKLMENYFLLAFVIVDPALQRVRFLFDGKNEYDLYTFANLARENTVDDKKFKDMMTMLGRRI